jgi:hypothetical protein
VAHSATTQRDRESARLTEKAIGGEYPRLPSFENSKRLAETAISGEYPRLPCPVMVSGSTPHSRIAALPHCRVAALPRCR